MLRLHPAALSRVHRRPHFNPQVEQLLPQPQNSETSAARNDKQTAGNRRLHAQVEEPQGYEPQRGGHPQIEHG